MPFDPTDPKPPERVLAPDGTLEGHRPPTARTNVAEAHLKLVEGPPPPVVESPPGQGRESKVPSRFSAVRVVFPFALVAVVAAGAWLFESVHGGPPADGVRATSALEAALSLRSAPPPLVVVSEPEGATVRLNGREVGQTPWAGENGYDAPIEVEISLNGHKPHHQSVPARTEAHLSVTLKRR